MENPWSIHSIYELQYFICPSCSFKDHSKQEFINHAYEFHPDFVNNLNIHDDSLNDIVCPWNKLITNIKIEETDLSKFLEDSNISSKYIDDPLKIDESFLHQTNELKVENCFEKNDDIDNVKNINEVQKQMQIQTVHEKQKDSCGKSFTQAGDLKKHVKTVH